jgi:hypothetical protein
MKTSTKIILLAIVAYLVLKKRQEKPVSDVAMPTNGAPASAQATPQQRPVTPVVTEYAGGSVITYNGQTYYTGGPIGKTVYDDMAAERAKYNSCPTHGTSTMRHIHTYNGGHVEDYYQCTVCGHRNTVYVK